MWNQWKRHRNKILATGFAALGISFFLFYYTLIFIQYGAMAFQKPVIIWNFFIVFIVYMTILVTNIRNSDNAYLGIMLFVFMVTIDMLLSLLPIPGFGLETYQSFAGADGPTLALRIASLVAQAAAAGIGMAFYVFVARYRRGFPCYEKASLFSWLLVGTLFIYESLCFAVDFYVFGFSWLFFAALFPKVLMALSVAFTLKRLRRY